MKKFGLSLVLIFMVAACNGKQASKPPASATSATAAATPVRGPFSVQELQKFAALDPIDAHSHIYRSTPAFYAMLKRLNLHLLNIMLVDDNDPEWNDLSRETKYAWNVVHGSDGYIALCTTFDPYRFSRPDFAEQSIRKINLDFSKGALAVKLYKNVGMEIKDAKGRYILPDNPVFEPIYKDIAAHNKTLIAHLADPDSTFEAPNPKAINYRYIVNHPKEYMYGKPGAPAKADILRARDNILKENPKLRMVGAHLGSMESNFDDLGRHLDQYPNFAVDLAGRLHYFVAQPREKMIAFFIKYQDKLIYGTDYSFDATSQDTVESLESRYANEWRYFATDDVLSDRGKKVQGLALPESVLRKIYHDNAVKWFPGILGDSRQATRSDNAD